MRRPIAICDPWLGRFLDCVRNTGLDGQVSGVAHVVRKHRRHEPASTTAELDRLLNVHAEVDHVHQRLDGPLNLIVTAGAPVINQGWPSFITSVLCSVLGALAWFKGTPDPA